MAIQGLSIYSSGDEDRIDATFCASILWARIFAPHDALAKFFRSLPFFGEPVDVAVCWIFVGDELPFDTLDKCASDDTLFRLAISPFSKQKINSFYFENKTRQT